MCRNLFLVVGVSVLLGIALTSQLSTANYSNNTLLSSWRDRRQAPLQGVEEPHTPYNGCQLPDQPEHGKYDFPLCEHYGRNNDGCDKKPNMLVPHHWLLKYRCDTGYGLPSDSEYSVCNDGAWKDPLDCITLCPPLESLSVNVTCFWSGQEVSCSQTVRVNTTAFAKCKVYYKEVQKPKYSRLLCQENGEWSDRLFHCEPECGSLDEDDAVLPLINGGKLASYSEIPWLTAIYTKNSTNHWTFKCGGTLISPHVVVTAAWCLTDSPRTSDLKVGLGKHINKYYQFEATSAITDVREVVIPRLYSESLGNYAANIALLDLAASVQMTSYIRPACVDWTSTLTINNGDVGLIGGWDRRDPKKYTSNNQISFKLSYLDITSCREEILDGFEDEHLLQGIIPHITHDKFCGKFVNEIDLIPEGGLTFIRDGKHFLIGVFTDVVLEPARLLLTDISNAEIHNWLQLQTTRLDMTHSETPVSSPNEARCRLPEQPRNGEYVSSLCSNNSACHQSSKPGWVVVTGWIIKFSCNPSYSLTSDDSPYSVCANGVWNNPLDCIKTCPPLRSHGVHVDCSFNDEEVSCDRPMRQGTTATAKCKQHYLEVNKPESESLVCEDRGWSHPLLSCTSVLCPPLESLGVAVTCSHNGQEVACGSPMRPNTTAMAKCKPYYKEVYKPKFSSMRCQVDGQWNHRLIPCTPDCGLAPNKMPLIAGGVSAQLGDFPWLTAIYLKDQSGQWKLVCGGTLISPHIVVTAASCLVPPELANRLTPEDVKVGLGKHYRDFYKNEPYSIIADVRDIVIPRSYIGYPSYALDIGLIDLTVSVQLTSHILLACVDWKNEFTINPGTVGHMAGWDLTMTGKGQRETVLATELSYIDYISCREPLCSHVSRCHVTHEKFCAESDNGSRLLAGSTGEGLTFVKDGRHFLFGVKSKANVDPYTVGKNISLFTDIGTHEHRVWLKKEKAKLDGSKDFERCPDNSFYCADGECQGQSVKCDGHRDCADGSDELGCPNVTKTLAPSEMPVTPAPPGGLCRLPGQPRDGTYTSQCQATVSPSNQSSTCTNAPGTVVSQFSVLHYSCEKDHHLSVDQEYSFCINGAWTPSLSCVKYCPPLQSLSLDVKCFLNGLEEPCGRPMRPNTTATAKCREHYHQIYLPQDLKCQDTGEWDLKLHHCEPLCGVSTPPGSLVPLIQHGTVTKLGEFPWLAGLYYQDKESKLWEQKCGGTLISPHIILTAAHCVVIQGFVLQPEDLKVLLGKYSRDYYTQEMNSVIGDVRYIATPPHYIGLAEKFALDIALLDLKQSVQINTFVMPACVDWNSNYIQPVSLLTVGYVAGWGKKEDLKASDEVLSARLTFINNVDCKKRFKESYNSIFHDKFCAGSINGSQVLQGDSGGGFTVVKDNLHIVLGVVSAKIISGTAFSLFTEIKNVEHLAWMNQKRNEFRNYHYHET